MIEKLANARRQQEEALNNVNRANMNLKKYDRFFDVMVKFVTDAFRFSKQQRSLARDATPARKNTAENRVRRAILKADILAKAIGDVIAGEEQYITDVRNRLNDPQQLDMDHIQASIEAFPEFQDDALNGYLGI
jgi:hypothetical protein